MATETERIFELLTNLDSKMDGFHRTLSDGMARIAGLEAWRAASQQADNRFWQTTWPAEQKVITLMEERIRILELERAHQEKVEKLEERISEIEKADRAQSATFSITFGVLTALGSGVLGIVGAILTKHFGG